MQPHDIALVVGNSDGIGLALTNRLLSSGWDVRGLSRSPSHIQHERYRHEIVNVVEERYPKTVRKDSAETPDLCVYCAGIGEPLDLEALDTERKVFEVNLMGAVKTIESILPAMVKRGSGHIVVLSSLADELVSSEAPSYAASKAGLSSYLEGLALAVRDKGVAITNVRFGFVDTKMAKGDKQPMKMTVERAVDSLVHCLDKRPIRFSRPRFMAILVKLARWMIRMKIWWGA